MRSNHFARLKEIAPVVEQLGAAQGDRIDSQVHAHQRSYLQGSLIQRQGDSAAVTVVRAATASQAYGRFSQACIPVIEDRKRARAAVLNTGFMLVREPGVRI